MTPVRLIGINTMCLSPLTIPGSRHHQLLAVLYPCSTKTREVLGNPSPTPERFPSFWWSTDTLMPERNGPKSEHFWGKSSSLKWRSGKHTLHGLWLPITDEKTEGVLRDFCCSKVGQWPFWCDHFLWWHSEVVEVDKWLEIISTCFSYSLSTLSDFPPTI